MWCNGHRSFNNCEECRFFVYTRNLIYKTFQKREVFNSIEIVVFILIEPWIEIVKVLFLKFLGNFFKLSLNLSKMKLDEPQPWIIPNLVV